MRKYPPDKIKTFTGGERERERERGRERGGETDKHTDRQTADIQTDRERTPFKNQLR